MRTRLNLLSVTALAAAAALAGCATPRVDAPLPMTAPATFKEARVATAAAVPDRWWTLFGDPVLDGLESRVAIDNQNLKAALAAVASARAALDASRAAFQPTLDASAGATRGAAQPGDQAANALSLGLAASWEPDLWGRLARAREGAAAQLQASHDDLAAATLSAQALLAQSYFALRTAEAQGALLERTIAADERALAITQARHAAGVAPESDVQQAISQLAGHRAQRIEQQAQRAQLEHAVAVLVGQAPAAFDLAATAMLADVPAVPALLPSTLLERRPDIAAAQQRVAAAYAQIGVADAAWFPDITLSANAGVRGAAIAGLLSRSNLLWTVGASLAESVFDRGQRQLQSAQARAAADSAVAAYRQTVLTSLQEVEDNLVLAHALRDEAQQQQRSLDAARRTLELTLLQYRAGTVGYLDVTVAQNTALSSESSLLALRNRELAAVNQLLKNVAGRWSEAPRG